MVHFRQSGPKPFLLNPQKKYDDLPEKERPIAHDGQRRWLQPVEERDDWLAAWRNNPVNKHWITEFKEENLITHELVLDEEME